MTVCIHEMEEGTCSLCLGLEVRVQRIPAVEIRASELFDYAAGVEEWSKQMACMALGWSEGILDQTVRELRRLLAEDDINLVVNQKGDQHLYRLVGKLEDTLPWATRRLRAVESQLNTIGSVANSICNATRANSLDGRKARLIQAQMNILHLQLSNLKE